MPNPNPTPDRVSTPEGDNEFAPDQPLRPLPDGATQDPRGNAPDDYRQPAGEA